MLAFPYPPLLLLCAFMKAEIPLDGGFVDPPKRSRRPQQINRSIASATEFQDYVPDKEVDPWTITKKFRSDIIKIFESYPHAKEWTIMELGSYFGYTTSLLSRIFRKVVAVDISKDHLEITERYNKNRTNIEYVLFNSVLDPWSIFDEYDISVAFVDAAHDEKSVLNDVTHLLTMKRRPNILIFDDYTLFPGVSAVVNAFVDFGLLICDTPLGKGASWEMASDTNGRYVGPEGMLCTTEKLDWIEEIRIKMQLAVKPRRESRRKVFNHARLTHTVPDKNLDSWSMSSEVQNDIQKFFITRQNEARKWTVLEIGSYVGYATSIIAPLVKKIVTVDIMPQFLEYSKLFNEKHHNIDYISLDTFHGNWSVLHKYAFDVVIVDGAQKWYYVGTDFKKIIKLKPVPPIVIFDDYGTDAQVSVAVDQFQMVGYAKCNMGLGRRGRSMDPKDEPGAIVFEAMVCLT